MAKLAAQKILTKEQAASDGGHGYFVASEVRVAALGPSVDVFLVVAGGRLRPRPRDVPPEPAVSAWGEDILSGFEAASGLLAKRKPAILN